MRKGEESMQITIIGTGYVGLVTGTCLADFGLSVTCVDQDETKISLLNSGGVPIYEPNLAPLIEKNISAGRLTFTTDLEDAVRKSKVIFIAVGTPSNRDGSANLKQIETVAQQIAVFLNEYKVIVIKSTVPVGTTRKINEIIIKKQAPPSLRATEGSAAIPPSVIARSDPSSVIARSEATKQSQPPSKSFDFDLVSNPEFLREGSAVYDFTHPDKIVIGTNSDKALKIMQGIYRKCFDPLAMENSRRILPDLTYCQDEYDTARNSHALVILTEWNQFRNIDLSKIKKLLKTPVLLDLKNLYEPEKVKSLGFIYEGIGRN
jgi:UDPglucose 6-dehydrogenase